MSPKEQAKLCIEVYGSKDAAMTLALREISFGKHYGTKTKVRYWTKVLKEIEKL